MLLAKKQEISKQKLANLFHFYQTKNEEKYQEHMKDYYKKLDQQMLHICFSGHFSAGKSTLMNNLMGEDLLPQSPIPTSANIVEIKHGEEKVIVHFTHQSAIEMPTLPSIDQLHQLCQDGEKVEKIEIYKPITDLPEGVTLMDTPGIDASNDADRIMTESSLHRVDVLFYVMDYNHVQSEVNASFLKQIDDMNKPYYVVINQMDKHDESEITLTEFKTSLHTVFKQWGIEPINVYFTSMADKQTIVNQFPQLQKQLYKIVDDHENLITDTLHYGVEYSTKTSIEEKQREMEDHLEQLEEEQEKIDIPQDITLTEVKESVETLHYEIDNIEKDYVALVEKTTKNAQIIPYDLREKARELLESYDPKFKIGLFRNHKKIAQERKKRLDDFYHLLKEKTEVGMEWNLREKVTKFLEGHTSVHFIEPIFETYFKKDTIINLMNEGATVNGDYVLNYTNQISQAVKKTYRQYYKNKWDELKVSILTPLHTKYDKENEVLTLFYRYQDILEKMTNKKELFMNYEKQLDRILANDPTMQSENIEAIEQLIAVEQVDQVLDMTDLLKEVQDSDVEPEHEEQIVQEKNHYSYQQTLQDTEQVTNKLKGIKGLDSIRQELIQKTDRLTNRHFTIALFGAFSAGKSSFANALIGEKVLPVSPNPTTAAINKISPVREPFKHKDVSVTIKKGNQLISDIEMIVKENFQDLEQAYQWVKRKKLSKLPIPDQHISFLNAFTEGYVNMKDKIGQSYVIDFDTFHQYVREESIACFVKEMELFYECALTNQHITLVDTPGADSVNARHTDLAFSYIKDADAILFVTYYNHPFSKPDQQFLERLGKVKEAFELDKMFFIINAVDLARNDQEKELVINYVRGELAQFEIKEPRMYGVSSKQALSDKTEATGLPRFEDEFYQFIQQELTQMSMRSIYTDIGRVNSIVTNWLSILNGDQAEKNRLIKQNKSHQLEMESLIKHRDSSSYVKQMEQKLNKQLFYATQRFQIQFTDVWKDHIHPGAIQSSGRKGKKEVEKALRSLWQAINQRLKEEYEAIAIRLEQTWNQMNLRLREDMMQEMKKIDTYFSLSELENIHLPIPEVNLRQIALDSSLLTKYLQLYKDTKSFFAENGRQQLEEEVISDVIPEWQTGIEELEAELNRFYQEQWKVKTEEIWDHYLKEVQEYYQQVMDGMTESKENKVELEQISKRLEDILIH